MSAAVVAEVRAQYPTPMTPEQCVKVCNETAYRLNGNSTVGPYGLHQKGGNNWEGFALEIVGIRDAGQLFDVLGNALGTGTPQWFEVPGTLVWARVREEWLPATVPPPDVPGTGDLEARVADLESRVARLESRFRSAGEIMAGL